MNTTRAIITTVSFSKSNVIRGLKMLYPENISLRALPDNGIGVKMIGGELEGTLTYSQPGVTVHSNT